MLDITPRRLYKVGYICFLIVFLMGLANYIVFFPVINVFTKIGSAFNLIFNIALTLFFRYMLKITPEEIAVVEPADIEKIIQEVKDGKPAQPKEKKKKN